MNTHDERILAAAIYGISFFTAFLGPLIIWLVKKDESNLVNYHGREYMNFFISYSLYSIISGILMIVLVGFVLLPIVGMMAFVFTIIAGIKAYEGEEYKIPFVLRIL